MDGQKYCKFCGQLIDEECVVCPKCGKQVEELKTSANNQPIVINNTNTNANTAYASASCGKCKNKWTAFLLCLFIGYFGAHKFYEGKIGMGILYIFTGGLFGIGWLVDCIILLCKPNPYYV